MTGERFDRVVVGVVLLTVDQRSSTLRCLRSLARVERPPHRIVVWDNGSVDGTAEAVAREFPRVAIHRSPVNLGAAAGRNAAALVAIDRLGATHLLFLDNDTVVAPDFLEPLVTPTLDEPAVGQTVPKIRLLRDRERLEMAGGSRIRFWRGDTRGIGSGEFDHGQYDEPFDCVGGGCTLVTREAFRLVGGFDPAFDPYGYEDTDFSLRVIDAGYRCRYVPRSVIHHQVTGTLEQGRYTPRYARFKARNWLLFLRRHAPLHQQLGFFLFGAPLLLGRRLLRGEGAIVRGLLAGLRDHLGSAAQTRREDR